MPSDYEFEMPWPPSVNAWKSPFRNRMILTKRGREYRLKAKGAIESLGISNELIDCDVSVSLVLNPPTLRRYDIDNFCKSLFDALTLNQFWIDDSQIVELKISKGQKVKEGNIQVKVKLKESPR